MPVHLIKDKSRCFAENDVKSRYRARSQRGFPSMTIHTISFAAALLVLAMCVARVAVLLIRGWAARNDFSEAR